MSAPQLALEWMEHPHKPSYGVSPGCIAWCGCGWRGGFASQNRAAAVEGATAAYEEHRRIAHPYYDEVEPGTNVCGDTCTEREHSYDGTCAATAAASSRRSLRPAVGGSGTGGRE